ncbi:MAG TPA: 30S ribosomal protein S5 [Candidatus Paceibacterota bacterium]|nr:30S ribosomal protein S5 [Candidatus Paceibacterota bacterium]
MENNSNPKPQAVTGGAPNGAPARTPFRGGRPGFGGKKFSGKKPDGRPGFVKPDVDYKILNIRRVARITAGGKRFTFAVALVVGDKKGSVGVGTGKAGDTSSAIEKAIKNGKKNMVKVKTTKKMSIPHETAAKFSSSRVVLRPAPGKGLVAGSSARIVLTLAGISDVSSKFHSRTKNPLNNAEATVKALKLL